MVAKTFCPKKRLTISQVLAYEKRQWEKVNSFQVTQEKLMCGKEDWRITEKRQNRYKFQ